MPRGFSPKIYGDWLHTGTIDQKIGELAIDCRTGQTVWNRELGLPSAADGMADCAIAEEQRLVLNVLGLTGTLYAFDVASGEQRWEFVTGETNTAMGGPLVVNDRVIFCVGLVRKRVFCVDLGSW